MKFLSISKIVPYMFGEMFHIKESVGETYIVDYNFHKGWIFDCPDILGHRFCKHMVLCHDFIEEALNLTLPVNVWCNNPKVDMGFYGVTVWI